MSENRRLMGKRTAYYPFFLAACEAEVPDLWDPSAFFDGQAHCALAFSGCGSVPNGYNGLHQIDFSALPAMKPKKMKSPDSPTRLTLLNEPSGPRELIIDLPGGGYDHVPYTLATIPGARPGCRQLA